MIAPTPRNQSKPVGSFNEPIRRSIGSTWTEREYRALRHAANFGSVAHVIRSLIPPHTLEQLIESTEAEQKNSAGN